jgi:probable rRNA maturation factor
MTQKLYLTLNVQHSKASGPLVSERRLRRIARCVLQVARQHGRIAIAVAFVDNRAMRRLNRQYAQHDDTTDVLSFPARENVRDFRAPPTRDEFLGDIIIALPQARQQAREAGHSLAREIDVLLTHGVLHLLGYDHYTEQEAKVMQALEARALREA